ncbi:uncharacterized protein DUF4404 [Azomonas agilis]|uniref:Uncharacterized protein DUF4404 n=1 Tax=Azomonas agilis TaxID=116849 RepID=A0A562I014_9GAMM|nr:DUF4404 family protein [Azomonas agilis]TWH64292.1 uncharacterized protein DUF4404 [Azomonas agilis]
MSTPELQSHLTALRDQLSQSNTLTEAERASLIALAQDITDRLANNTPLNQDSNSLTDTLNLAVERLEVEHPTLVVTLRNIVQSLANMGI